MDADHQLVIALIFLYHLQSTGLIGQRAVEGITQKQQNGFVASKLRSLIDGVTESSLLSLIDIAQAFANRQDTVLVFLCLRIQFTQVFL